MINNEYWDGLEPFVEKTTVPWRAREARSPDGMYDFLAFRRTWVTPYSWTISDPSTLDFVRSYCPGRVLDPIAGTGWWASLLQQAGNEVLASDLDPPSAERDSNIWHRNVDIHVPVKKMDAVYAMDFSEPEDTLLLSWPPASSLADRVLKAFRGRRVVYLGEHGGTDASNGFFDRLAACWRPTDVHTPIRFECMNDAVSVWTRDKSG